MPSHYNLQRYYYNEYANAVRCFDDDDFDTTEELCAALVTDFMCPRFVQIQAWQLRSTCTSDYWRAKSLLESALKMFETMDEDELVLKYRTHTEEMLASVEELWQKRWADLGEDPPEEQPIQHTYTTDEAEMEAEVMADALAQETAGLALGRELIVRGGSPETEQQPGGAEAPWIKGPGTEPTNTSKDDEAAPPPSPPDSPPPATPSHPMVGNDSDDDEEL